MTQQAAQHRRDAEDTAEAALFTDTAAVSAITMTAIHRATEIAGGIGDPTHAAEHGQIV